MQKYRKKNNLEISNTGGGSWFKVPICSRIEYCSIKYYHHFIIYRN